MLNEKENYLDMINAGAMGFVLKTSGKQEFEKAIGNIMNGESYFSNELLRRIILNVNTQTEAADKQEQSSETLTSREKETLQLLSQGLAVSEIAEKLFISPKTVEAHRSMLLKKTNSKNTINLVLYAIKNKIVSI